MVGGSRFDQTHIRADRGTYNDDGARAFWTPGGGLSVELAYPRAARRRAPEISWVVSSRLTRSSNETHVR
jgi:hypothetical protein